MLIELLEVVFLFDGENIHELLLLLNFLSQLCEWSHNIGDPICSICPIESKHKGQAPHANFGTVIKIIGVGHRRSSLLDDHVDAEVVSVAISDIIGNWPSCSKKVVGLESVDLLLLINRHLYFELKLIVLQQILLFEVVN